MVNDTIILVVNQTGANTIQIAPSCVIMNSEAQLVMIDKMLAQELRLMVNDLALCPFIIYTSIGHVERATDYSREPLQVKPGHPPAPFHLKCAVMEATKYDILFAQQTLYPAGF